MRHICHQMFTCCLLAFHNVCWVQWIAIQPMIIQFTKVAFLMCSLFNTATHHRICFINYSQYKWYLFLRLNASLMYESVHGPRKTSTWSLFYTIYSPDKSKVCQTTNLRAHLQLIILWNASFFEFEAGKNAKSLYLLILIHLILNNFLLFHFQIRFKVYTYF